MAKFSFYRNEGSRVGGGRFWQQICDDWQKDPRYGAEDYDAIFFNISGPLREFIRQYRAGKKIIVRVDGVYHEKISRLAVASIPNFFLRFAMSFLFGLFSEVNWLSELFNLFPRNFGIFIKIRLSRLVVFQSEFSRKMYSRYVSENKKCQVVTNGFPWSLSETDFKTRLKMKPVANETLRLITTYDSWRPSKRLQDLVQFVMWCNETQKTPVHLTILGYHTERRPANLNETSLFAIEHSGYFSAVPPFKEVDESVRACFAQQHMYATFTYRDNCPNAVIEAMAFGLPVLAVQSGGLPDIVRDAGQLIPLLGSDERHFSSFDRSYEYPEIHFPDVFEGMRRIAADYPTLVQRVKQRFDQDLDVHLAANRYLRALDDL